MIDLRMGIQSGLVNPALKYRQPVSIQDTLKDLELFAARFLHDLRAACLVGLRQFRALARGGGDSHDESYGHGGSLVPRKDPAC